MKFKRAYTSLFKSTICTRLYKIRNERIAQNGGINGQIGISRKITLDDEFLKDE